MRTFDEVWTAYRALASDPDATAEVRQAFWKSVEADLPAEAAREIRQIVDRFLSDELGEPPADEPTEITELRALWRCCVLTSDE
jgi:hypothetical protein